MITVLALQDGRKVYLDGDQISQQDAMEIARSLMGTWGVLHPKAVAKVLVEVTPRRFSDCPYYDTLEEGLQAEGYQ